MSFIVIDDPPIPSRWHPIRRRREIRRRALARKVILDYYLNSRGRGPSVISTGWVTDTHMIRGPKPDIVIIDEIVDFEP